MKYHLLYIILLCAARIPFIASLLSNFIAQRGTIKENSILWRDVCVFFSFSKYLIPFFSCQYSYMTQKRTSIEILSSFLKAVSVI